MYEFLVHIAHPNYRLVIRADRPFPSETSKEQWRLTRRREADDVNAEVRKAVSRDGSRRFRIGFRGCEIPQAEKFRQGDIEMSLGLWELTPCFVVL